MAPLILQTAEGQQAIDLRPVNSLGRHPNNSIQLLDKIVSKEHCIIELRTDHWGLRDLGSLNGTFVNNERVRGEAPLKHGDEIALGATKGRFDDGGAPLPAAGPPAAGPGARGNPGPSGRPPRSPPRGLALRQPGLPAGPVASPAAAAAGARVPEQAARRDAAAAG